MDLGLPPALCLPTHIPTNTRTSTHLNISRTPEPGFFCIQSQCFTSDLWPCKDKKYNVFSALEWTQIHLPTLFRNSAEDGEEGRPNVFYIGSVSKLFELSRHVLFCFGALQIFWQFSSWLFINSYALSILLIYCHISKLIDSRASTRQNLYTLPWCTLYIIALNITYGLLRSNQICHFFSLSEQFWSFFPSRNKPPSSSFAFLKTTFLSIPCRWVNILNIKIA